MEFVFAGPGRRKVFAAVGRCIYCGTDQGTLTEEHIIPQGLGGNMILPAASCGVCQKIINDEVENPIQNAMYGMLGPLRARLGLQGRKPKKNKKKRREVTLTIEGKDGVKRKITVEGRDVPFAVIGFETGIPGITCGRKRDDPCDVGGWFRYDQNELAKVAKPGESVSGLGKFEPLQFCRLLAKIALAGTYARFPYERVHPYVRDLILGRDRVPFHFIGCQAIPDPDPKGLHQLSIGGLPNFEYYPAVPLIHPGSNDHVAAIVRLFCSYGTPEYLIVVGEVKGSLDEQLPI